MLRVYSGTEMGNLMQGKWKPSALFSQICSKTVLKLSLFKKYHARTLLCAILVKK